MKKDLSVMIKPASSICNMRCKYCFYHSLADSREVFSYGLMNENTAKNVIEKAIDFCDGGSVCFAFQGGEPLFAGKEYSPGRNAEIVITDFSKDAIPQIMQGLYDRGITSVIVEGGLHTLQKFIDSGLWDEVRREIAPIKLFDGVKSPCFKHGFDISYKIGGSTVFYSYSNA